MPPAPVLNCFFPAAALAPTAMSLSPLPAKILSGDILEQNVLLATPVLGGEGSHTRPTLKIQDGCNSPCSYCVIPFLRGRTRCLPPQSSIPQIRTLTEARYPNIV